MSDPLFQQGLIGKSFTLVIRRQPSSVQRPWSLLWDWVDCTPPWPSLVTVDSLRQSVGAFHSGRLGWKFFSFTFGGHAAGIQSLFLTIRKSTWQVLEFFSDYCLPRGAQKKKLFDGQFLPQLCWPLRLPLSPPSPYTDPNQWLQGLSVSSVKASHTSLLPLSQFNPCLSWNWFCSLYKPRIPS